MAFATLPLIHPLRILLIGLLLVGSASAEVPPSEAPGVPANTGTQPVVVYGADGKAVSNASPLGVMTMPFVRATPDPIIFDGVTTTPKQFAISKPAGATTYRFINPCNVDVRIRKVSSLSETVTATTGIRYLARTVEVVGTSNPSFVSIMAMSEPSAPCAPELQYGNGS